MFWYGKISIHQSAAGLGMLGHATYDFAWNMDILVMLRRLHWQWNFYWYWGVGKIQTYTIVSS